MDECSAELNQQQVAHIVLGDHDHSRVTSLKHCKGIFDRPLSACTIDRFELQIGEFQTIRNVLYESRCRCMRDKNSWRTRRVSNDLLPSRSGFDPLEI